MEPLLPHSNSVSTCCQRMVHKLFWTTGCQDLIEVQHPAQPVSVLSSYCKSFYHVSEPQLLDPAINKKIAQLLHRIV